MKTRIAFVGSAAALMVLAGCGSADHSQPNTYNQDYNSGISIHHVPVDGKTVTCLQSDGLSCDWTHAK